MALICSGLLNSKLKVFNNIIYKVDGIFRLCRSYNLKARARAALSIAMY